MPAASVPPPVPKEPEANLEKPEFSGCDADAITKLEPVPTARSPRSLNDLSEVFESIPPEFKISAISLLFFKPANTPAMLRLLTSKLNTNCSLAAVSKFTKFTVKLWVAVKSLKSKEKRKFDCEFKTETSLRDSTFSITPNAPEELNRIGFATFRFSKNKLCKSPPPSPKFSLK